MVDSGCPEGYYVCRGFCSTFLLQDAAGTFPLAASFLQSFHLKLLLGWSKLGFWAPRLAWFENSYVLEPLVLPHISIQTGLVSQNALPSHCIHCLVIHYQGKKPLKRLVRWSNRSGCLGWEVWKSLLSRHFWTFDWWPLDPFLRSEFRTLLRLLPSMS